MQPQGKENQQAEDLQHGFDLGSGLFWEAMGPTLGTSLYQPWEAFCLKHLSYL